MGEVLENRIRHTRDMSGLSRTQVAAHVGVSERIVYRWETHETPVPDSHKLKLAELFGVSVPWLMGWVGLPDENGNGESAAA